MTKGKTYVGIGGWTFEPWRGTFYPEGLKQKDELAYAASHLTAIEINGTYYSTFKPESFRKWADAAPEGFKFTVKASRFCTNRKVLAEGGESVQRFVNQGLVELGGKLGPILWQFMPTKKFDADDFGAFLALLPGSVDGVPLRHAVEVRHESFRDPAFPALAKAANVAIVHADHAEYPLIEADTADFTYARLMRSQEEEASGYIPASLDDWAEKTRSWEKRGEVFAFFISGAKVRNPAAAQALIARLQKNELLTAVSDCVCCNCEGAICDCDKRVTGLVALSRNYLTTGSNEMRYAVNGATVLVAVGVQVLAFYGVLYA